LFTQEIRKIIWLKNILEIEVSIELLSTEYSPDHFGIALAALVTGRRIANRPAGIFKFIFSTVNLRLLLPFCPLSKAKENTVRSPCSYPHIVFLNLRLRDIALILHFIFKKRIDIAESNNAIAIF